MDIIELVKAKVAMDRRDRFRRSNQLSLGELIEKLSRAPKQDATVAFDFGDMVPDGLESWRGSYAELALEFKGGWDGPKCRDLLLECQDADGKTFTGYKGGDFTMHRDTPIWVANHGYSGHTMLVDVMADDYKVILVTAYGEF